MNTQPLAAAPDDDSWLPDPEERRSFARDLRESLTDLWAYRGLTMEFVRRDLRVRYKQTVMGFGWALLTPLLIVASGALVRIAMAHVGGRHLSLDEIAGMSLKALPWSFFVGSIGFATQSLTASAGLVTKIYFPREVLPLASTIAHVLDAAVGATVVLLALPLIGVDYGAAFVWVPVLAACAFLFTAGVALLASCANLFLRDVKYIVQVFLTFGIFFTPVFFEPHMFGPRGAPLMMLNPMAPILEGLRLAVIHNHSLLEPLQVASRTGPVVAWSPLYLGYAVLCATGAIAIGLMVFHRAETRFAEYV
jgi:ABC-type polysaccharide/polyol phosphate export permease